ncbi:SPARC-like protein 1 [Genypterus blacodes]|uniref:SPARC-like protein 1 n=1 Tax=Genypterus blacodes TaxID=154954 RepID=UPI003F75945D
MRACLVFIWLLATFAFFVKSKPHGKHHASHKSTQEAKEKGALTEEVHHAQILPTLVPFEASSQELEAEEVISEENLNANTDEEDDMTDRKGKNSAVLLSEEELAELMKKDAEEEEENEAEEGEQEKEMEADRKMEFDEAVEVTEDEEAEADDNIEMDDDKEEIVEEEDGVEEGKEEEELVKKKGSREEMEEIDGSTESEIPVDLDYAAESGMIQHLKIISAEVKPHTDDSHLLSKTDVSEVKEEETNEKGLPSTADEHRENTEAAAEEESQELERSRPAGEENVKKEEEVEEEKDKNESATHAKGKTRKQKKNQRMRKHSPQRDDAHAGLQQEPQREHLDSEGRSNDDDALHKAKRRRAGKWGPVVGMNPVQIRATVDLYPDSRPPAGGGIHHPEAPADPCDKFRCKRGKTCKLNADNKPSCVCQEPAQCPPGVNEFDHVCGTDNNTYDTSCELFATKCKLDGTKRGHRLHLDYTGSCKLIPPCLDAELVQFPLRMRDWLKNVLLQLYDHDSMSPGFLTAKQRFRVKKMYESERRLHAGDHSVELLAHDFEKNYNMYIYPVHWQFAQLDQHPSDRILSHSELAPLRVPLVPMEHCTPRFFQECDADRDKQVSFKEWASCFGIRNEDMDANLLF